MSKKIFFKGVFFSYVKQIISLIIGIISLPFLLNYLGNINYGIWMLIIGLGGYLNTIAFGIPSAMITLIAKSKNVSEKYSILKKSFYILCILTIFFLIFFIFSLYINDNWIISFLGNIQTNFISIAKSIFIFFVIGTLIKLPLNLYIQFFIGMNAIYISQIYEILIILINFISILIAVYLKLKIFLFVVLWLSGQLLINIIAMVHVIIKYKIFKINFNDCNRISYRNILKSGFAFFQVGIAATIVWNTDNLLISHFLSPEMITPYSIAFKIFTYVFMFSTIINGVVGPIYGNAYANKNWETIQKYTSIIHKILPTFSGIIWIFLIFFAKDIILFWTGKSTAFGGYLLIFSLGLYGYVLSFINTYATLIFSLNYANKTLIISWGEAVLNLILSIFLIKYLGIGGVALGTALAAFVMSLLFPNIINKLTKGKIIYDFTYIKKHFIILLVPSVLLSIYSIKFNFLLKIIIFIILLIIYIVGSWIFLSKKDKIFLLNILIKKGGKLID